MNTQNQRYGLLIALLLASIGLAFAGGPSPAPIATGGSYDIATLTCVATNTAATRLTTDGSADGAGNRLTLASGSAVTGVAIFSSEMNNAAKSTFGCVIRFTAKRVGSTVMVVNNSIENILDPVSAVLATSVFRLVNDDANGTYYPEIVVGNAAANVSTSCRIDATRVTNP